MSFSYIGNVVSAQLIRKETPPKLQAQSYTAISSVWPYPWIKLYFVFFQKPPHILMVLAQNCI